MHYCIVISYRKFKAASAKTRCVITNFKNYQISYAYRYAYVIHIYQLQDTITYRDTIYNYILFYKYYNLLLINNNLLCINYYKL